MAKNNIPNELIADQIIDLFYAQPCRKQYDLHIGGSEFNQLQRESKNNVNAVFFKGRLCRFLGMNISVEQIGGYYLKEKPISTLTNILSEYISKLEYCVRKSKYDLV